MKETIYKLFKGTEIIYIGKTNNLNRRLREHKNSKCYTYTKAEVVDTSKLKLDYGINTKLMEAHLIAKYKPKFNYNHNPNKLVKVGRENDYQLIQRKLKILKENNIKV